MKEQESSVSKRIKEEAERYEALVASHTAQIRVLEKAVEVHQRRVRGLEEENECQRKVLKRVWFHN